ncbi:MAG: bifunctional UDP-sugar hydrolase/5'-nucleotidase [Microbacterium sp.]
MISSPKRAVGLTTVLAVGALTMLPTAAGAATDDDTTDIEILSINDFHGRIEADGEIAGAAVLAGAVESLTADNPNTLLVSAGDNIGASTFTSFIQQDNPTIDALVASGLSLSAVGNHEFDQGYSDIVDRVIPRYGSSDFALGANVYDKGTTDPALPEYAIREIDGVKIGFIGTVTADTSTLVDPTGIADIDFGSQLEAANRVADEIADETDAIILLTHSGATGTDCDAAAAEQTEFGELVHGASSDIDAIVSAHTHQLYSCTIQGPDGELRPVTQTGSYGNNLGTLSLSFDADKNLVSATGGMIDLVVDDTPAYDADPDVQAIVDEASASAEELGSQPVGKISADILRGGNPPGDDRGVESTLNNTIADVYLWATSSEYSQYGGEPADIAVMNAGGLRADLLYSGDGTVTYKDVANVQPFGNTLTTTTLTGANLKDLLEEQWQPGEERPKLQLGISDGLTYEYVDDAEAGEHIKSITFQGEAVQPDDTFLVTTNSFVSAGGDSFVAFLDGTDTRDTGLIDLSSTVDYFAAHDVVDPAPLGRAVEYVEPTETPTATPTATATATATATPTPTPTDGPLAPTGAADGQVPLMLGGAAALLAIAGITMVAIRRRA